MVNTVVGMAAHVLVVEDDANTLNLIREYLSRANFHVRSASDGWEALKAIKAGPVDLIISELVVSDMDGASLREKCLLNPETRDVPFLFLLAKDQTERHVSALRSGVDDCITKPFDPIILVARVQAVIQRRHAYEQMVRVDPLTRLLNRPSLERDLETELDRVRRYRRFAALVLMDVDSFQQVNKDGGVSMGDLLLTCFAGIILTSIRTMDIAGRYHGGQFMLFLPETPAEGAQVLAQRIQTQLTTIADTIAGLTVTFTCGIVMAPEHGEKVDLIIQRVEDALSFAKQEKRGGCYVWQPPAGAIA
ncbi:MAG: diguanylate cyclase [Candidatus Hydrogenedentes bacterium]|nr:diguanylate cyclase [Candidatus Hydrogenedentota bacterium]